MFQKIHRHTQNVGRTSYCRCSFNRFQMRVNKIYWSRNSYKKRKHGIFSIERNRGSYFLAFRLKTQIEEMSEKMWMQSFLFPS